MKILKLSRQGANLHVLIEIAPAEGEEEARTEEIRFSLPRLHESGIVLHQRSSEDDPAFDEDYLPDNPELHETLDQWCIRHAGEALALARSKHEPVNTQVLDLDHLIDQVKEPVP